ncbi:hypothetical protein SAMN04515671_2634 [Nakamurella panacisegetis]|uniref:Integral membrane protein n=1 Tax=Nakamurella panacisegetis TaxID=1090615 RepID=A0A1H0P6I0_9ACTN|nr:hypothetical protein [Nakamurella panacisegetis]SDP00338.1 hypothetical protein SAMN04515671_2634 [Nakamurella panacisegetis]
MIDALAYSLVGAGLLLGIWCGVQARRNRPTDDALMIAAIALEVALVVQTAVGLARLGGAHLAEPVTYVAYAVGILFPLPLGFYLARLERTRWGSTTLGVTAVVVGVMTLRLLQIWRSDLG